MMPSLRNFRKELALIDIELFSLEIPRFYGQNNEFTTWFSKVEQAFACHNLSDQEKFKVVISKLRGCALQWWKNYKFKRRKKGKEKVRTWKKLRGKLMGSFCPPTCMLKHASLLPKKNGLRPSCVDILLNKGSAKSHHTSSLPTLLPLKEIIFYQDEEVNEEEEDLNRFDLPPIFDDYGDEELLDFEELGETSVPSSFCEEEELACKEELHLSLYNIKYFHQEDKVEVTRDFYPSSLLVPSHKSLWFRPIHPWPQNKKPQTHKCFVQALTHDFTSQNPKVRPKKFDGSFPMVEKLDGNRKREKCLSPSLQEHIYEKPHKIHPQELENLRANSLQQGEDDVPMGGNESEQVQRQSTPKEVQEHQRGQRSASLGQKLHEQQPSPTVQFEQFLARFCFDDSG